MLLADVKTEATKKLDESKQAFPQASATHRLFQPMPDLSRLAPAHPNTLPSSLISASNPGINDLKLSKKY